MASQSAARGPSAANTRGRGRGRVGPQLRGRRRVAHGVRAFEKEAEPVRRRHAVARAADSRAPATRATAGGASSVIVRQPAERVHQNLLLQLALPVVPRCARTSIRRTRDRRSGSRRSGLASITSTTVAHQDWRDVSIDARAHALAGNGAGHEHDAAVVPGEHAPARHRALDGQFEDVGHRSSSGRPSRSRSRRSVVTSTDRCQASRRQPASVRREIRFRLARRAARAARPARTSRTASARSASSPGSRLSEFLARLAAHLGRAAPDLDQFLQHPIAHVAQAGRQIEPAARRGSDDRWRGRDDG